MRAFRRPKRGEDSVDETTVTGQIFGRHELQVVELSVFLSPREQFVVGADFDDTAVNDDDDAVGAAHSGQPMRDHQRRAVGHQMLERFLHGPFGGRVE